MFLFSYFEVKHKTNYYEGSPVDAYYNVTYIIAMIALFKFVSQHDESVCEIIILNMSL